MNDDDGLAISLSARIGDFQKSMTDASASAARAFAAIETRGDQTAKKVDTSFGSVGKTSFTLVSKGLEAADLNAVSLVNNLKRVQDQANATKGLALGNFAMGQQTSATALLQQVSAAGSLKNFAAMSGGALGVGAIAAGMVAEQTKQLADLKESADEARTTASEFAGLQQVFSKIGIASDDSGRLIKAFAGNLLEAKAHGGELKAGLDAAGISFQNADGSLRPTIEVLQDLISHMRGSSDEAGKLQLATAAVGDQLAGPFVNAVKNGGTALDNLQAASARVGSSIQNDLAAMAQSGIQSLNALSAHLDQLYSRMKEMAGFKLTGADQTNVAEEHMREAQGALVNLQMASNFRDVSPDEIKAAWQRIFDAGKEVAKANPISVLPGGDPREKGATPKPIPTTPAISTGGGHASSSNDDDKSADVIARLRLQLQLAQSEGDARQKIADEIKVARDLKEAGVAADSAEGKIIADLVRQTSAATDAAKTHKEALEATKKALDGIGSTFSSSIESLIIDGGKLSDVFHSLAQSLARMALQAALTGQGAFGGLVGGVSATTGLGGIFGSLLGGLAKLAHFADGGQISGPGTGTSDSILARVSHGEYIVNAKSAKANLPLLAAINQGRLPKFASGGLVGATSTPSLSGGGSSAPISITNHLTVNAQGGDPAQNADLGKQVSKHLEATMRGAVADELRRQMRPGNMLGSMR